MSGAASSRGLFRATGKTAKPVAIRDLETGEIVRADALTRERDDFYPTPPEPTLALAFHEREAIDRARAGLPVWEPACGNGAMMRDLESVGIPCIGTDLIDRGGVAHELCDFFTYSAQTAPWRAIITNPPFKLVNWRDGRGRWIPHALETLGVRYMALLLPHGWPGAGGLEGLLADHPPSREYLMCWKIDFTGQGAPPMLNAWFVWDLDGPDPRGWRKKLMYRADAAKAGQGVLV
jgi:hypothetical protein